VVTRTRLLLHALASLLLACVTVAVLPPPAGATVTRLCTGYSACERAGMSHAGYAQVNQQMYWRMYSGHNCTNYAAYRMIKSGMPNVRPWDGGGNATYWGTSMPKITDTVPRVGAIAWWRAGVYPAGSAGHVAYVEEVVSSSEIIISQDMWGGDFSWARITRSSGWPSGFIHFNDVPMRNVAAPTISGESRIGATMTATPGTWNPKDVDVIYEWRAGGETLKSGSENTYTLSEADTGKQVRVKVTASKLGYPSASAFSDFAPRVQVPEIVNTAPPTIEGTPQVDQTLTAKRGRWSPGKADSRTFQWRADGAPVKSDSQRKLTLTPDLVGKAISVTVEVSRAGYKDVAATSAPTAPVTAATITPDQQPTLTGAFLMGETLTLEPGTASPDATRSVQWLRGGEPIRKATGLRYQLTAADLGQTVTAQVTWTRPGYRALALEPQRSGTVRSVTSLSAELTEQTGGFVVDAQVTAPEVSRVPSVVRVVRAGEVLAEKPVRADGTVRLVVRSQRAGERQYKIRVPRSDVTTFARMKERVTIQ
jgi:surface antigen